MNNTAIQFFALTNPGMLGQGGTVPGMQGVQGMTGLFQAMMGTQQGLGAPVKIAALQHAMGPFQGMGASLPGMGLNKPLMTDLPTLSVISTVQSLGLGAQTIRQTLETLMPQIKTENPGMAAQLTGILEQSAQAQNPDLALIQSLQGFIREQEIQLNGTEAGNFIDRLMDVLDGSANLFTDLASMNLDEFKAFKEHAFADMAGFITQPKQVLGPDGRVREFLSGPSFLNADHGNGASVLLNEYRLSTPVEGLEGSPLHEVMLSLNVLPATPGQMSQVTNMYPVAQSVEHAQHGHTLALPAAPISAESAEGIIMRPTATKGGVKSTVPQTGQAALTAAGQTPNGNVTNTQAGTGFLAEMGFSLDSRTKDGNWLTEGFGLTRTAARETTSMLMDRLQAGRANPIAQNVATAMARLAHNAAAPGEKSMTIFMDPPELGRVEVQMKFGPNKSVKTHITVEKPETYAMLQRDAQTLNRALTNLGLDTAKGADISFDLSHGEHFDGSGRERGGQHSFMNGRNASFEETLTILETTMDVYTDPQTGLRHLNVVI